MTGDASGMPTVIDLFCGCGGMSEGFLQAGFQTIAAFDCWDVAVDNYNHNHGNVARLVDVRDVARNPGEYIPREPDVIAGGPPCQGYSMAGRRDEMDPRNSLVDEYYTIIEKIRPKYFVMENVVGMRSMKRPGNDGTVIDWITRRVREIGYTFTWKLLRSHWYGVGQDRPRLFFVGWRDGARPPAFPPPHTHSSSPVVNLLGVKIEKYVTAGDVLASIPASAPNQDLVYKFTDPDYIARVEKLPQGESVYATFKEAHRRLDASKPAFTMKENHGSIGIHPTETRMINLREMAALQGFRHDYEFIGNVREIAKVIGNAVPPGMARAIAREIKKVIPCN